MEIKNLEQALKLQKDFTTRLAESLVAQPAGKMPAIEVLLKEKEQMVVHARAEVEAAIKERDAAVSRWDERVEQRKESVARLQKEMGDLKKQLAKRKDTAKDSDAGKTKKEALGKKPR
ncbi:MAG: hypothetical protein OEV15_08095 [Gallionella sp.]|nr:hypothetical protein [Gallionella sp.]